MRHVLVIDDETNMRWVLGKALEQAGYAVHTTASGDEGLALLSREPIALVLLDLKLRGEDGLTVLRRLRERRADLVVMMLTAYGTVPNAVEAMQLGAADFLRKPFDVEEVVFKVARGLERRAMQQQITQLTLAQHAQSTFASLVGSAPVWQRVVRHASQLAALDINVLVVGEAGSGRSSIACAIHTASPRRESPFIEVDLAAYADPGYALFYPNSGLWEKAGNGTLLIHGVFAQPAMLPTLIQRAAADATPPRLLLVATAEQAASVAAKLLPPTRVDVPPLRERCSDILLLAHTFAAGSTLSARAAQQLEAYTWPGNVAELRGVIERARVLAGDQPIDSDDLPQAVIAEAPVVTHAGIQLPPNGVNLEEVEQHLIRQALAQVHGNKSKAADLLGLTRHTLLYRMEKYNIL